MSFLKNQINRAAAVAVALAVALPLGVPAFAAQSFSEPGAAAGRTGSGPSTSSPAASAVASGADSVSPGRSKISGINPDRWTDAQQVMNSAALHVSSGRSAGLMNLRLSAGDEVRIYLDAHMFVDADGNPFGSAEDNVSKTDLKEGKVSVSVSRQQGPGSVKEISLEYDRSEGRSYIKLEFVDPFTGTRRRTVAGTVRLRVDGRACPETEFEFYGQLSNTEIALAAGTDYVNLEGGLIANPSDFIKDITVDLGQGVSIVATMFADKKYYGSVSVSEDASADNAESVLLYQLSHSNLGTMGTLYFDLDGKYHVYDSKGAYLGSTEDGLPVARSYYLVREYVDELQLVGPGW